MTLFGSGTALDAVPHTTHVDTLDTATRRMATPIASHMDTGVDTPRTPAACVCCGAPCPVPWSRWCSPQCFYEEDGYPDTVDDGAEDEEATR